MWLFDPGWQSALDSAGARDMARLFSAFASRPWFDLVPDQRHEIVIDGLGEFNGLDYLTAARTKDGESIVVYLPTARPFTVNLGKISGKNATAYWFNPRTGHATSAGQFPATGSHRFLPPAGGDWVLVIDDGSLNLPPPGSG
jgi:hypothetical protein